LFLRLLAPFCGQIRSLTTDDGWPGFLQEATEETEPWSAPLRPLCLGVFVVKSSDSGLGPVQSPIR
jgi:hypothetical protein